MAEDPSYDEILDQNVGEVKDAVRDLQNPDYEELLELEEQGKDRKTVKEFLESRIEDSAESSEEVEETENIVETIEEETSDGLLGGFSRSSVLTGGVVLGILIGLIAGFGATQYTSLALGDASQAEIESSLDSLFTASGVSPDNYEITTFQQKNGMNYVTIEFSQQGSNQTNSRSYYVSPDGDLLFPEIQSPLVTSPLSISDMMERLEGQNSGNQTGNTTQ